MKDKFLIGWFIFIAVLARPGSSQESRYYYYDDGSQLIAVATSTKELIEYKYDRMGNRIESKIVQMRQNSVAALFPYEVSAGSATRVTIVGSGLALAIQISFQVEGVTASITSQAETAIVGFISVAPTVPPGIYVFTVQRSIGDPIDSGPVALIVTGAPTLTSLAPAEVLQGQTVQSWQLTGSQLSGATGILFDTNGLSVANLAVAPDGTSLTARLVVDRNAPLGTTGVRVQTPAGISNRAHLEIKPGYQFIQYGETVSGSINPPAEVDTYAFEGTVGDRVFLRMSSSAVDSQLRVYRPDGTALCNGQASPLELSCVLDTSGAYTILATDNGGNNTGVYSLHLQRTNGPGNATPINFGETLAGALTSGAEADAFTFVGTSGDRVLYRMSSSAVDSQLRVYRPDGTALCNGQASPLELSCVLDTSGAYAILATDNGGNNAGVYSLHLQRTNGPGNATPINFGDTLAGTLTSGAEADAFTFVGTTGDRVLYRMSSSAVDSQLRVYRPDGTALCNGQASPLELSCVLDTSGAYTILATDNGGNNTGGYSFHLQRTNGPGNATPINFGDTLAGTLTSGAEVDAFTFVGTSGDRVLYRMSSSAVDSQLRVYRPDGTALCNGQASPLELSCVLGTSGAYTILATDNGGNNTGVYSLHLQRTNGPGNATPINFGDTLAGTLTSGAEVDAFTFVGTTGDRVLYRMSTSAVDPQLRVYRPDGTSLCSGQAVGLLELSCSLDTSGTYTVLATDNGGNNTGGYSLHLQRTNGPESAASINFGATLIGSFILGAEADAFTFAGASGDRVFLRMSTSAVDPQLRVYRPDGTSLCSGQAVGLLELSCSLDTSGTYTVLATDNGGNNTGGYSLHVQRTNSPGNAAAINFGDTLNGGIAAATELDAYTFSGIAGNPARVTMTRTSGSLSPKFRVYHPDGTELCNAETTGAAAQTLCALDSTGTYTILAGDRGGTATGNYTLSLQPN